MVLDCAGSITIHIGPVSWPEFNSLQLGQPKRAALAALLAQLLPMGITANLSISLRSHHIVPIFLASDEDAGVQRETQVDTQNDATAQSDQENVLPSPLLPRLGVSSWLVSENTLASDYLFVSQT